MPPQIVQTPRHHFHDIYDKEKKKRTPELDSSSSASKKSK